MMMIVVARMMMMAQVALETLEGHQRAIMGSMTVEVGFFEKDWFGESSMTCTHEPEYMYHQSIKSGNLQRQEKVLQTSL